MFTLDLHTHSCLSPCADLDMHPSGLVDAAVRAGLDGVAVCDHHSAENLSASLRAGAAKGMAVIPGMEITTAEEVHLLGLFPDIPAALEMQSRVYSALPGRNVEEFFGMQVVADEFGQVLGFNEHFLAGATTLELEQAVDAIHRVGGLVIAAHIDRERYGLIGQLGMIPPGLPLDGVEISSNTRLQEARQRYSPLDEYPLLCSSDAHDPKALGGVVTFFRVEQPTPAEIRLALEEREGRMVLGGGRPMEDLSLHLLDIVRNSIEAGATAIDIELREATAQGELILEIHDNGRGMSPALLEQATDPFFTTRTTRRIGMGLALLADAARTGGGSLHLDSTPGQGTRVRACFQQEHIDRAPLGDLETALMVLYAGHPELDLTFRHEIGGRTFELIAADLRAAGIDPAMAAGLATIRRIIRSGERELHRGVADDESIQEGNER